MGEKLGPGRFFVVAYDITDDGRRVKVANLLKSYGERVQLSVFECWLTVAEFKLLKQRLGERIDLASDSVRFYRPEGDVEVLGAGRMPERPDFYLA